MKKKNVLIISLVAAAILLAGFACVAIMQGLDQTPSEEPSLGENKYYSQEEDSVGTKIFAEGTSKQKTLKYEKTLKISEEETLDVYVDTAGKEYRYDQSGTLKGITDPSLSTAQKGAANVEEEKVKQLSYEYGLELYGAEFEEFSFDSYGVMATGMHNVFYSKRYGEGGYIQGPLINFMLTTDGQLYSSSSQDSEEYDAVDEKLLNSIKKADLDKYVAEEIKKTSPDREYSCEATTVQLKYEDGKYYLQIIATVEEDGIIGRPILRYDFEQ